MATFKVIKRPAPPKTQLHIVRQEVLKLTQPVIKHHISQREQVTSRFTHKPRYESRVYVRDVGVTITILLKNARERVGKVTLATLMDWLFVTGTKPHLIIAKAGRFLAFASGGYKRKTGGGAGSAGGPLIFRKRVPHPGFAPSKQLDRLDKQLEPTLKNAIDSGYRIGHNRAKK